MPIAFVQGYGPLPEDQCLRDREGKAIPETTVGYGPSPDNWRIPSKGEADLELWTIKALKVYVGQHSCNFRVLELTEGDFAIACVDHPVGIGNTGFKILF